MNATADSGAPVELDTIFRVFSMTKPITTVAAMMLVEEGLLQLRDPVAAILPEFADQRVYPEGSPTNATTEPVRTPMELWHLMTHTSGLTYGFLNLHPVDAMYRRAGFEWGTPPGMSLADCCQQWAALPLLFQPGAEWNYSVATDVLGRVVEVVSGQSLDDFFAERILEPLGMVDTGFAVRRSDLDRLAALYFAQPGTLEAVPSPILAEVGTPRRRRPARWRRSRHDRSRLPPLHADAPQRGRARRRAAAREPDGGVHDAKPPTGWRRPVDLRAADLRGDHLRRRRVRVGRLGGRRPGQGQGPDVGRRVRVGEARRRPPSGSIPPRRSPPCSSPSSCRRAPIRSGRSCASSSTRRWSTERRAGEERGLPARPAGPRGSQLSGHAVVVLAVALALLGGCSDDPDEPADPPATLADAVEAGDVELARSLLEGGADPDEPRVLSLTPLMRAGARDDVPMTELLVEAGADLAATDAEGLTAAHVAARADAAASLAVLLDAGADVTSPTRNGMNALHHAATAGSSQAIELLAGRGAALDQTSAAVSQGHGYPRDVGATALGLAAQAGDLDAVETLLALGADVDAPSTAGHTPLLLAVFAGQPPEVVAALLAAGADPCVQATCERGCSVAGGDALEWARELERTDLVPLLESATG